MEYLIQGETLTGIADAIRGKTGGSGPILAAQMAGKIGEISVGGDTLMERLKNTMTSYVNNEITSVISYGLSYQTALTSVSMPNCTSLGAGAFYGCSALAELYLPALVSIRNNCFRNCYALTQFITGSAFDSCIESSAFEGCSKLTKIDLYHVNNLGINAHAFACANLTTLIIRNTDFVAKANSLSIFGGSNTAMNQGTGYIYVPASMVDSYKEATNWTVFADQIRAIEDYPDITGGVTQ